MKYASETMAMQDAKFTLIVQGGAVNVILGDRPTTADMDFIATDYKPDDPNSYKDGTLQKLKRAWLLAAADVANSPHPIPRDWVDSSISALFFGNAELFQKFKSQAILQNEVLSTAGMDTDGTGIKYIAAPWEWQIVRKLGVPKRKEYDHSDAAFCLRQWLKMNNKESVHFDDLAGMFQSWHIPVPKNLAEMCMTVMMLGLA
ncbi:hypothetical protein RJ55_02288 [Drechmeria coniospora]|nr:hypothetical protein RJ55_02288 [Drechmeria coniospora]